MSWPSNLQTEGIYALRIKDDDIEPKPSTFGKVLRVLKKEESLLMRDLVLKFDKPTGRASPYGRGVVGARKVFQADTRRGSSFIKF